MTTNDYESESRSDTRPIEEHDTSRPEPGFDELIAHEESYTPPPPRDDTSQDAVPIEVLPPEDSTPEDPAPVDPNLDDRNVDDPTPPDVAPQAASVDGPVDGPVDDRPDVPRDLDGDPTDFTPLQVQTFSSDEPVADSGPVTVQDGPPSNGAADDDARWQEIQVRFVDDPAAAVGQASDLVEDAVARLRESYGSGGSGDSTEQLRLAFRRYRSIHELATRPDVR